MTSVATNTSPAAALRTAALSAIISAIGTGLLLTATVLIGQQSKQQVPLFFVYQGLALAITMVVVLGIRLVSGTRPRFLRVGNLRAAATPVRLLGVKSGESWGKIGTTFAIIVTVATAAFLIFSYGEKLALVTPPTLFLAMVIALPLSVVNALTEEVVTRWTIAEGFSGNSRLAALAPWVSAVIFGSVHYFGIPGGLIGALMAGFLAWLATRSIQDTGGIGWAFILHLLQDIMIFTVTLSVFL